MEPVSGCLIRKTCMSSPFEVYLKEQNKHFQSSGSVSFSYKQADTNPAAGLMLFHTFDGDSWEIQETFFRQYKQVCHPGGAGLPVQKECASGTASCCQYWQEWYWKIPAKERKHCMCYHVDLHQNGWNWFTAVYVPYNMPETYLTLCYTVMIELNWEP